MPYGMGESKKKDAVWRQKEARIILFKFNAVAERRQWSSAASIPRRKSLAKLFPHASYPHKQIHNSMIRQPAKIQGSILKRMFPVGDTKMVKGKGGSGWIHKQFLFLHCNFVSRLSACSRRAMRFSVGGWLRYRASVMVSGRSSSGAATARK